MIKTNIVLRKYLSLNSLKDHVNIKAARNIKELLAQIDLSVEVIPENNLDMFSRLISSLKKEELSKDELRIIKEIVQLEK